MVIKNKNMQEIRVTMCVDCPKFCDHMPKEHSPRWEGFCVNIFGGIDILTWIKDKSEIPNNCPIKGETITYKIGESNE